jgi:hypothetical protein
MATVDLGDVQVEMSEEQLKLTMLVQRLHTELEEHCRQAGLTCEFHVTVKKADGETVLEFGAAPTVPT